MGIGLNLPPPAALASLPAPHHQPSHTVSKTECTCGARAFEAERMRQQIKRIAPMGFAGFMMLHAMEHEKRTHEEEATAGPERKRSLWRKILGKGPKCICSKLPKEHPKLIQLPSEYDGCRTVRVGGKRVPYSREMQQIKRRAYKPMDTIREDA